MRTESALDARPSPLAPRVLIGGVGYRWMRDGSIGLVASDELMRQEWPAHVEVADLGFGAIYVTQDLAHAEPPYARLVLLAGVARGRTPGRIYRSCWSGDVPDAEELQELIREAGAGIVEVDHLLAIARYFGALPDDVVLIELEPVAVEGGEDLSPEGGAALPRLLAIARDEALAPPTEANAGPVTTPATRAIRWPGVASAGERAE